MEYISIILTIIFGVPGLIIFLKSRKTKLFYLEEKQINLQEDLLENFSSLKITYDNIEINNKISYIRGSIVCYGNKDLVDENNQIEISTHDSKWLNFKIKNISKGLAINIENKENKILLSFGLLKKNEFFEFEALLERNENSQNKAIRLDFFHRIANIPDVKKIDSSFVKSSSKSVYYSLFLVVLSSTLIYFICNLNKYRLESFNSITNKEIPYYSNVYLSDSYKVAEADVIKNYYGVELMFGQSKYYIINYTYIKDSVEKNAEVQIYFKKDTIWADYCALILFSIFLLIGLANLYNNIIALNQKKLMKHLYANS